jgi:hypothetical protein
MPMPTQNRGLQFAAAPTAPDLTPAIASLEKRVAEGALRPEQIQRLNSLFTKRGQAEEQAATAEAQNRLAVAQQGPAMPATDIWKETIKKYGPFVDASRFYEQDGTPISDVAAIQLQNEMKDLVTDEKERREISKELRRNQSRRKRLDDAMKIIRERPQVVGAVGGSFPAKTLNNLADVFGISNANAMAQEELQQTLQQEIVGLMTEASQSGTISPRAFEPLKGAVLSLKSDPPLWEKTIARVQDELSQGEQDHLRALGQPVDKPAAPGQTTPAAPAVSAPAPASGPGSSEKDPVILDVTSTERMKAEGAKLAPGTWFSYKGRIFQKRN